jgi:hypothetical protein
MVGQTANCVRINHIQSRCERDGVSVRTVGGGGGGTQRNRERQRERDKERRRRRRRRKKKEGSDVRAVEPLCRVGAVAHPQCEMAPHRAIQTQLTLLRRANHPSSVTPSTSTILSPHAVVHCGMYKSHRGSSLFIPPPSLYLIADVARLISLQQRRKH